MLPQRQFFGHLAPSSAPRPSIDNHASPPGSGPQRRSSSNEITAVRAPFLENSTGKSFGQLRKHDSLCRDMQYHENKKKMANFNRLERWHLDCFLKETGQPLRTEQQRMPEEVRPSPVGRRRDGNNPALTTVDSLSGSSTTATFDSKWRYPGLSYFATETKPCDQYTNSAGPVAHARRCPPTQGIFYVAQSEPSEQHLPHEIWDYETIDCELERILVTAPVSCTSPIVQTAGSAPQETTPARSGVFYPSTLPQSCATGNKAVDDEMKKLLEYAYQAELTSLNPALDHSEDKNIPCQVIGDSQAHW